MGHSLAKAVALITLFTVLGSAQCINLCTVKSCEKARATSVPADANKSCHRSPASSEPEPTQTPTDCTQQPMLISEKGSSAATALVALSFLPSSFIQSFPAYADLAIMTAHAIGSRPTQASITTVILRI